MDDLISRQDAIDQLHQSYNLLDAEQRLEDLPSAQPETYKKKLKEIADALSEKFAYMNTCLNERDIILGYLGVERPSKNHCNTDCTYIKCESYRFDKRLPSAQSEDWMERNKERILQAGMEGREIEFRIGGRLFAIREKAQ